MSNSEISLRKDVLLLSKFLQKLKEELASVRQAGDESDRFRSMSHELGLITEATENATNTILESAESIDGAIAKIDAMGGSNMELFKQTDAIRDSINNIFEASSFQDITGQRVSKVINSLQFIDEAVGRMVDLWGADEIAKVEVELEEEEHEEQGLLNGPDSTGHGISQDEIDAFFD